MSDRIPGVFFVEAQMLAENVKKLTKGGDVEVTNMELVENSRVYTMLIDKSKFRILWDGKDITIM